MGVLLTGPAGSGKASLVEAVAARGRAPGWYALWAPQLAALEPNAAAAQLRAAARRARAPAVVLLVEDVEALAPARGRQPAAADAADGPARGGRRRAHRRRLHHLAAPSRSTPRCAAPARSTTSCAVPLPDRPRRLRAAGGRSRRGVPLDADVDLDDVAARTPGFVAADLRGAAAGGGPAGRGPPARGRARRCSARPTSTRRSRSCGASALEGATLRLGAAHARRRRRHGRGQGRAHRGGAVAAAATPTPSPGSA